MHNYEPNQRLRQLTIRVAVRMDVSEGELADEMSAIFQDAMSTAKTALADWGYVDSIETSPIVQVSADPQENEGTEATESICPHCGRSGRTVRCPYCGRVIVFQVATWVARNFDDPGNTAVVIELRCGACQEHFFLFEE